MEDIREVLDKDTEFADHMKTDTQKFGRALDEKQKEFFLEEHTLMILTSKMRNNL